MVAGDRVVRQAPHERLTAVGRGVLERPDPDVAGRDAGEHRAGQQPLPRDLLARRDHGERAAGRDPERVHRLAEDVLAQHRPDDRLAVASARERRAAGALEVQVAPVAVRVEDLAEQQRATIAQPRRVRAELMAGVRHRDRRGPVGPRVAGERRDPVGCPQGAGIDAELGRQPLVEHEQARRGRGDGLPRLVQPLELAHEGVVEREQGLGGDAHGESG